jgi:hypothetical protein
VGGHSPALSVNRAATGYDPLELAKSAPIDKLRIFLDAGDRDWTRAGAQDLSKVLTERYIPHTYTVGKGDHDYPYWATQVEAYLRFYGAPWKAEQVVERLLAGRPVSKSVIFLVVRPGSRLHYRGCFCCSRCISMTLPVPGRQSSAGQLTR